MSDSNAPTPTAKDTTGGMGSSDQNLSRNTNGQPSQNLVAKQETTDWRPALKVNYWEELFGRAQAASARAEAEEAGEGPAPVAEVSPSNDTKDDDEGGEHPAQVARGLALLSKKEKALREEKARIEAERAALARWAEAERLAKEDPLTALEKTGLSLEQLIRLQIDRNAAQPDPVQSKIEKIEAKLQDWDKQYETALQQAEAQKQAAAVEQFQSQIRAAVEQNADDFAFIRAKDAYGDVYELIEAHFDAQKGPLQSRKVMPIEEALRHVEAHYEEEANLLLQAQRAKAAKKGAQQANEEDSFPESEGTHDDPWSSFTEEPVTKVRTTEVSPPVSPTLGNSRTAAPVAGTSRPGGLLPRDESLRRIAARLPF